MKDFIKIVKSGNGVNPPPSCVLSFDKNFAKAVNIEWLKKDDYYESIFYKDNIEHIAIFETDGNLVEYKKYLPKEYLPEAIKIILETKGEIMNIVLKNKGNVIEYGAIIRDTNSVRYSLLLSDLGVILSEYKL